MHTLPRRRTRSAAAAIVASGILAAALPATAGSAAQGPAEPVAPTSSQPALSAGGQALAFVSPAPGIVAQDTNGVADVFVQNLTTGSVVRASLGPNGRQANGPSSEPALTNEGRYAVFTSSASNLVPGDTNGVADVFRRDLQLRTTVRVSARDDGGQSGAPSGAGAVSGNGRFVVFESSARLTSSDTDSETDVFLRNLVTGRTRELSPPLQIPLEFETATSHGGVDPSISRDGRYVSYGVWVTTENDQFLIVLRLDRWTGTRDRVCGGGTHFGYCHGPVVLSGDGTAVAYQNSIPAGQFGIISYFDGRPEWWGFWNDTYEMALSTDGNTVAFTTDIPVSGTVEPLLVRERESSSGPELIADFATQPTLSADGCRLGYVLDGSVRVEDRCS